MKRLFSALAALVVAATLSYAAYTPIPLLTTAATNEPSQINATFNGVIQQINSSMTPANFAPAATPRNFIDNGAMAVHQRGTATVTCGTTTIPPTTAYGADRWGCNANVTSGAGISQVITTSPAPPAGFPASTKLYRTSGALTQPICSMQEISSANTTYMAGQVVTLSFYAAALAGLSADNGNVINAYIFTGTGTDQGLQSFTASPAITPAFTGISSVLTQSFTISTTFGRYGFSAQIPATATEMAVAICFTPTATGAGATDGFAYTGAQLEIGNGASAYEFRSYTAELLTAQAYFVQWADNLASTFSLPATCAEITSGTTAACTLILPTTMRTTPTTTVATATSFGKTKAADGTAGACSTLAAIASSNTPNSAGLTCALSETAAVGTMGRLIYANSGASNTLIVSADY